MRSERVSHGTKTDLQFINIHIEKNRFRVAALQLTN